MQREGGGIEKWPTLTGVSTSRQAVGAEGTIVPKIYKMHLTSVPSFLSTQGVEGLDCGKRHTKGQAGITETKLLEVVSTFI